MFLVVLHQYDTVQYIVMQGNRLENSFLSPLLIVVNVS